MLYLLTITNGTINEKVRQPVWRFFVTIQAAERLEKIGFKMVLKGFARAFKTLDNGFLKRLTAWGVLLF